MKQIEYDHDNFDYKVTAPDILTKFLNSDEEAIAFEFDSKLERDAFVNKVNWFIRDRYGDIRNAPFKKVKGKRGITLALVKK